MPRWYRLPGAREIMSDLKHQLLQRIRTKRAVIGVVGLGYVGLPLVLRCSESGFKVVGFDNIPAVGPLLKDGKMLATVEQYGAQMAALGIDYGLRELAGEKFTGWVKTDIKLITA